MAARSRAKASPAKAEKPPARRKRTRTAKAGDDGLAPGGSTSINIKRAYDPAEAGDGLRILIDRLWPRGMPKSKLKLDAWAKHLSPSNELRKWYQHDPDKFTEFRRRYLAELKAQGEGLAELREAVRGRSVTLLTATRELDLSHATVLRELLAR